MNQIHQRGETGQGEQVPITASTIASVTSRSATAMAARTRIDPPRHAMKRSESILSAEFTLHRVRSLHSGLPTPE